MKRTRLILLLGVIIISAFGFSARAQDMEPLPVDSITKYELLDSITAKYYDWNTISMSGKISGQMLPMTVSMKIYMEKDSLVVMSISAPIIGEAARIEIDTNEILAVNKLSNSYTTLPMEELDKICPGGLTAFQNLLLGRMTLLDSGELSPDDADKIDIYLSENGNWLVLPKQDLENSPYVYFFFAEKNTLMTDSFMLLSQDEDAMFECVYLWDTKNYTLDCNAQLDGKTIQASVKLNYPDVKTKPLSRIELTSKYKRVRLSQLMRF